MIGPPLAAFTVKLTYSSLYTTKLEPGSQPGVPTSTLVHTATIKGSRSESSPIRSHLDVSASSSSRWHIGNHTYCYTCTRADLRRSSFVQTLASSGMSVERRKSNRINWGRQHHVGGLRCRLEPQKITRGRTVNDVVRKSSIKLCLFQP